MCGIEYGNISYIHCPDPLMGISISSESWLNKYIVKYLSSLMLGEIESSVLNVGGGHSHSSVYEIFSSILNHENFTVIGNENILEIYLNNNPQYKFVINLENGTVYDLTLFNGFIYKGAVSPDFTYCYCYDKISNNLDSLTNDKYPPIYREDYNFTMTDDEWNVVEDIIGDFAISASFAAILPYIPLILIGAPIISLPVVIGVSLLFIGVMLKYASNDFNIKKSTEEVVISLSTNLILI